MLAHPFKTRVISADIKFADRHGTEVRSWDHHAAIIESQHHIVDATNPRRALHDGVQDRLHVGRRAADNAEHL